MQNRRFYSNVNHGLSYMFKVWRSLQNLASKISPVRDLFNITMACSDV